MIGWIVRKVLGIPKAPTRASAETPGAHTSEGQLTLLNTVVAAVLALLAMFWPDLPREEIREVVLWAAGIVGTGSVAAYSASRAHVKSELAKLERSVFTAMQPPEIPTGPARTGAPPR